jgi:hypothetical protein
LIFSRPEEMLNPLLDGPRHKQDDLFHQIRKKFGNSSSDRFSSTLLLSDQLTDIAIDPLVGPHRNAGVDVGGSPVGLALVKTAGASAGRVSRIASFPPFE